MASFMLRFVQGNTENRSGSASTTWYGLIKHVQTDTEESFERMIDALSFMVRYIDLADIHEIIRATKSGATATDETLAPE